MLEFQQFQDKIRRELRARMKFSKDLLELRDKEAKLVRMKRYEEAEKVKMKADLLEEFERNKLEAEVSSLRLIWAWFKDPCDYRCKQSSKRKRPSCDIHSSLHLQLCSNAFNETETNS